MSKNIHSQKQKTVKQKKRQHIDMKKRKNHQIHFCVNLLRLRIELIYFIY